MIVKQLFSTLQVSFRQACLRDWKARRGGGGGGGNMIDSLIDSVEAAAHAAMADVHRGAILPVLGVRLGG